MSSYGRQGARRKGGGVSSCPRPATFGGASFDRVEFENKMMGTYPVVVTSCGGREDGGSRTPSLGAPFWDDPETGGAAVRPIAILVLIFLVPASAVAQTWEVVGQEAKLRLTPDEYATTIAVVPGGTRLKQLDKFSYWVKVQYKDHMGWITQYNLLPVEQKTQPPVEIRRADFSPMTRRQCFVVTNRGTIPFRGFI